MNTLNGSSLPLTRLGENELSWRKSVRSFAETHVQPLVRQMDEEAILSPELLRKLFAQGLMSIEIPGLDKGMNGTFFQVVLAIEELARIDPAVAVCVHVQNSLVINALWHWGSTEQKRRYLPLLATTTVGAYAMSEEEAGSDAFAIMTTAEPSGDGFILNGKKCWTTNVREAGLFLIFAKTLSQSKADSITAFLVDRSSPGLKSGKEVSKLGIRACSTGELILENVRVPHENVLGQVGEGNRIAMETLNEGRIGIAAQLLGLAKGMLEAALDYAQKRQQFGRPIATYQGVHFPLAQMATEIEAARLLVYNAARLKEQGASALERIQTSAMAKYFASQVAERVASEGLEIFGGNGYIKDFPAEKFYRDVKVGKIYEGTSNIQLRTIAATIFQGVQAPPGQNARGSAHPQAIVL